MSGDAFLPFVANKDEVSAEAVAAAALVRARSGIRAGEVEQVLGEAEMVGLDLLARHQRRAGRGRAVAAHVWHRTHELGHGFIDGEKLSLLVHLKTLLLGAAGTRRTFHAARLAGRGLCDGSRGRLSAARGPVPCRPGRPSERGSP